MKTKAKWEQDIVEKKRFKDDGDSSCVQICNHVKTPYESCAQAERERKLEEQKKQRKAEREIMQKARRLQEMELEARDEAEALERKKAEAEREAEKRQDSRQRRRFGQRRGSFRHIFATED